MQVSLSELASLAGGFLERILKHLGASAYIVGLEGDLGACKTTFVQHVSKILGVLGNVTSPTFVLAQSFPIRRAPFTHLIHIDAYRLTPEEKDTIGWKAYAANPTNLIFVEWPERLPGGLPKHIPLLKFSTLAESMRDIV